MKLARGISWEWEQLFYIGSLPELMTLGEVSQGALGVTGRVLLGGRTASAKAGARPASLRSSNNAGLFHYSDTSFDRLAQPCLPGFSL